MSLTDCIRGKGMHADYIERLSAERKEVMARIDAQVSRIIDRADMLTASEFGECFKDLHPLRLHVDALDAQLSYYQMLEDRARGFVGIGSCKPAWSN